MGKANSVISSEEAKGPLLGFQASLPMECGGKKPGQGVGDAVFLPRLGC